MQEEQALGGSPAIAAGDDTSVADTERYELKCSHYCSENGKRSAEALRLLQEMIHQLLTLNVIRYVIS